MRFWSEGLGDKELVMALGRAKLDRSGEMIELTGVVDSPAPWEYEVKIQLADWITILRTATSIEACDFIATHVNVGQLLDMTWNISKFVALLTFYRLKQLIGAALLNIVAADEVGSEGPKRP